MGRNLFAGSAPKGRNLFESDASAGFDARPKDGPTRPPILESELASDAMQKGVAYGLKAPGMATTPDRQPAEPAQPEAPQHMGLATERYGPGNKAGLLPSDEAEEALDDMIARSTHLMDQVFAGYDSLRANRKYGAAITELEHIQAPRDETSIGSAYGASVEPSLQQKGATLSPEDEKAAYTRVARLMEDANTLSERAGTVKMSDAAERFITAESAGEAWDAFLADPVASIVEVTAQSAAPSAAALAGGAVGGVLGGPVGFAAGMGLGSASIEYASGLVEGLRKNGVDVTDPEALRAAVKDRDLMADVRLDARRGAASVGSFDAAAGLIAPLKLAPASWGTVAREITNVGAQTTTQGALGGAGEAGKQLANEGRISSYGEVGAEIAGEAGFAPVETATATATARNQVNADNALRKAFTGEDLTGGEAKALGRSGLVTLDDSDNVILTRDGRAKATELFQRDAGNKKSRKTLQADFEQTDQQADDALGKLSRRESVTPEDITALKRAGYAQANTGNVDNESDIELTAEGAARFRGLADTEQPGATPDATPTGDSFEPEQSNAQAASQGQGPRRGVQQQDAVGGRQAQAPEQRDPDGRTERRPGDQGAEGATEQSVSIDTPSTEGVFDPAAQIQKSLDQTAPVDQASMDAAESPTNDTPTPTEGQKAAGNYRKGHVRVAGLDVAIENPNGSTRTGTDANGKKWRSKMVGHYGYVKGSQGNDGDAVDVFIKPGTRDADTAYVIDQYNEDGSFDEHKTVLGADSLDDARQTYRANYPDNWQGDKAITAMPIDQFRGWLDTGDLTQPAAPQQTTDTGAQPSDTAAAQPAAPRAPEAVTRGMRSDLSDLGYAAADIDAMTPDAAAEIIADQRRKPGVAISKSEKQRERVRTMRRIDNQNDDIITAIRKLGGINTDMESDWRGRLSHLNVRDKRPGLPGIEQTGNKGLPLDRLAEALAEEGYVGESESALDQTELYDMLRRAESGEPVYGNAPAEDALEARARAYYESQADAAEAEAPDPDVIERETGRPTAPLPEDDNLELVGSGSAFTEDAYRPDWGRDTRSLSEWFERASDYDPNAAERILSSGANDASVVRRLQEVIVDGRQETQSALPQRQGAGEGDPRPDGRQAATQTAQAPDAPLRDTDERTADTVSDQARGDSVAEPAGPAVSGRGNADVSGQTSFNFEIDVPSDSPAAETTDTLATRTGATRVGTLPSSIDRVSTPEQAAHVVAALRKSTQEKMVAIVTDADDRVLGVIQHTMGTINASAVYPGQLAAHISAVDGADSVWFAHNHPSGKADQSRADKQITEHLQNLMRGTGITTHGMIVVAPNGAASYDPGGQGSYPIRIEPGRRNKQIPVTERRLMRFGKKGEPVTNAAEAAQAMTRLSRGRDGVMLMDTRYQPIGFVPMAADEMGALRTNQKGRGATRLWKAIADSNAAAMIAHVTHESDVEIAQNLGSFAQDSDIQMLDILSGDEMHSQQATGGALGLKQPFMSRKRGPDAAAVAFTGDLFGRDIDPPDAPNTTPDEPGPAPGFSSQGVPDATRSLDAADRPENFDLARPTRTDEQADAESEAGARADQSDMFGGQAQAAQEGADQARDERSRNAPDMEGGLFGSRSPGSAPDTEMPRAPNGQPSNLTPGQHAQVRTPAFKTWFGDWEGKAHLDALRRMAPITITEPARRGLKSKQAADRLRETYRALQNLTPSERPVTRDGRTIRFGGTGFRETRTHAADRRVLQVIPQLPELLRTATPLFSEESSDTPDTGIRAYHHYGVKTAFPDGNVAYTRLLVREHNNGEFYYDNDSIDITDVEKALSDPAPLPRVQSRSDTPDSTPVPNRLAQWAAQVNAESASQVVDANGEPRVLYHGTNADFSQFDASRIGSRTDEGHMGAGFYFGTDPNVVDSSDTVGIPVYLSIKNPVRLTLNSFREDKKVIVRTSLMRDANASAEEIRAQAETQGYDGIELDYSPTGYGHQEWVAFRSEQIKSATGNRGTFDSSDPDIRFSFAGERAHTADANALDTARQRLDAGENAETVRQDTGWRRGDDGQWRFEIDDSGAFLKGSGTFGDVYENRYEARAMVGAMELGDDLPLESVLRHTRLFAAYPELAQTPVRRLDESSDYAGTVTADGAIAIKESLDGDTAASTLMHEIQHLIQVREGFARGGNVDTASDMVSQARLELRQTSQKKDVRENQLNDEARRIVNTPAESAFVERAWNKWREVLPEKTEDNPFGIDREGAVAFDLMEQDKTYQHLLTQAQSLDKRARAKDGRDAYKRLAGEVEARNTQSRQSMTDEQRAQTPPSRTADTPTRSVIVSFNGEEMASAPANAAPNSARTLRDQIVANHPDVNLQLRERDNTITLDRIELPKAERNNGTGSAIMRRLTDYADQTGQRIALSPTADFGGNKTRLKRFYQKLGFRPNTGARRDPGVSETMLREPQGNVQAARAYHGTPHQFDKFSLDAIGTGEGAQAYGYGLYFAQNRDIAEYYRDAVSMADIARQFTNELPEDADFDEVMELVDAQHFSPAQARVLRALEDDDWLGFDYPAQSIRAAFREVDSYDPSPELEAAIKDSRRLYQVDIPEDHDLLDWDAPLSEQPYKVLKLLSENGFIEKANKYFPNLGGSITGKDLYLALKTGFDRSQSHVRGRQSQKEASRRLNGIGIPGLRYLDNTSRQAQAPDIFRMATGDWAVAGFPNRFESEQDAQDFVGGQIASRNYVIWDESRVTVEAVNDELRQARIQASRAKPSRATDGASSEAPTAQETADVKTLRSTLETYLGQENIDLRVAPGVSSDSASAARSLGALFGKRVVFFQSQDAQVNGFNGIALPGNSDVIYLNANADMAHTALLGHELTHYLKRDNPQLWAQLEAVAMQVMQNMPEYRTWLNTLMAGEGQVASDELVREEMIADFIGDQFLKPSFWNEVMDRAEPGVARRLADQIRRFLDNVLRWLNQRGFGSSRYFSDIQRMRDAAADAFAQYARADERSPVAGDQYAASRDPKPSQFAPLDMRKSARQDRRMANNEGAGRSESPQPLERPGGSYIDSSDQLPPGINETGIADELIGAGAQITSDGRVRLYHRTTQSRAQAIAQSGAMRGKEDGLFLSTSRDGQAEGYGDAVVELDVPIDRLLLDDIFEDEAHVRIPTKRAGESVDVSQWIAGNTSFEDQPGQAPGLRERTENSPALKGLQLPNSVSGEVSPETQALNESDRRSSGGDAPNIRASRRDRGRPPGVSDETARKAGLKPDDRSMARRIAQYFDQSSDAIKADVQAVSDEIKQGMFDRFHGIKTAEQRALGKNLPAEQSAYVAARLSTGTSSVMHAMLLHGAPEVRDGIIQQKTGTRGLLDVLEPVRDDINGWLGWMVGRRAQRLMSEGRENNFTQAQIDELIALGQGNEARYNQVAEEYAKFKDAVLDVAQASGLIDAETRPAWDMADHIPFYRADSAQDKPSGPFKRKGLSHQESGIRQLRGSDQAINDPLENIMLNFTHLIDSSLKNEAMRRAVENLEGTDYIESVGRQFSPATVSMDSLRKSLEAEGVDIESLPPDVVTGMRRLMSMHPPRDKDVARVMIDGKPKFYRINDRPLLRALTSLDEEQLPLGMFRAFKRLLTGSITADPSFMMRNFMRDALHAWTISEDAFVPLVDSARGIGHVFTNDAHIRSMMFAGAAFQGGYLNANEPGAVGKSIRRALRSKGFSASARNEFMSTVLDTPARAWEAYRDVGDSIENSNRAAVVERARKAGKSTAQSVYEGKDLMDFSMRGSWAVMRALNDMVPFLNARLQGLYKLGRAGALPGRKMALSVAMRGSVLMTATLALYAINKDDDRYKELEEWDKDLFWHFWIGDQHYRWPKPFEIGLLYGMIPERIARAMSGRDDPGKTFDRFLFGMTQTLSFNPTPQLAQPAVELWANKSFFTGRDIESMRDQGVIKEDRYSPYTSDTARWLSRLGASEAGLSPKQIEYLVRGYGGTMATYALSVSDLAIRWAEGAPVKPARTARDIPFVNSLYRGKAPPYRTRFITELYDTHREAQQIYRTVNDRDTKGEYDKAEALEQKKGLLLDERKWLGRATDDMGDINQDIREVYQRRDMTAQEKRDEIDELHRERNAIAEDEMRAFEDAKRAASDR